MKRGLLFYIITIVCIAIIIISLVGIYMTIMPKHEEQEKYEEIKQEAIADSADVRPVFK